MGEFSGVLDIFPTALQIPIILFVLSMGVALFAILIWNFYRFVAKKNILELNLNQYNKAKHPVLEKIFESFLYFLEYIIIMPFLVFFWFAVFAIFLLLLSENLSTSQVLLIATVVVSAIRITSY